VDLIIGVAFDARGYAGLIDGSTSGYYVSRNADCAAEFEGGLPATPNPLPPQGLLRGDGQPVVAVDPVRGAVFAADERAEVFRGGVAARAIGVFRTTRATLLDSNTCPGGTHTAAQARTCWPTRRNLAPRADPPFVEDPHLAVDERATGVGAGDVYIVYGEQPSTSLWVIKLVACTNSLRACASPVTVAGRDGSFIQQLPHVAVRPDGIVGISWGDAVSGPPSRVDIFHAACLPRGAPTGPACGQPQLVHRETQSLEGRAGINYIFTWGYLSGWSFPVLTYPKHDSRVDANGIETYVVWNRCKVPPVGQGAPGRSFGA
jgi:hypothetical protein